MTNTKVKRNVHEFDATDRSVGRFATEIAQLLIGKHKPAFERHLDLGDFVTVTNVEKIRTTEKKLDQKLYHRHSGYPGGLKTKTMRKMFEDNPADVLEAAVSRMLPKNKHRNERLKRLKIS